MSRTGSTYARRWPIRWAPLLRHALVASLLLAAVPSARAGWVTMSVRGTPNDVEVWAPGVYSVSTTQGAWLFRPMDVPVSIATTSAVGTYRTSTGCLIAFLKNAKLMSSLGCTGVDPINDTSGEMSQVKATESGAAYAVSKEPGPGDSRVAFSSVANGVQNTPWIPGGQLNFAGSPMTLGALSLGASEHALLAVRGFNAVDFRWIVDGVEAGNFSLSDTAPPLEDVQSIDLFSGGGSTPTVLFGWANNLYRGTLASSNTNPVVVPIPGGPGNVTGVVVNEGAGSQYGQGFGMATVQRFGGVDLLSAVPAGRPEDIGTQWRVNSTYPAGAVLPRYLACQGAKSCVVAQTVLDTGNLIVYTNTSPPMLPVDPELSLPESSSRTVDIRVSDPDGDAVRVAVTPSSLSAPPLSMTTTETAEGVSLALTAGPVCANAAFPITISASDGLQAHDQVRDFVIQVLHTQRAAPPGIASRNIIVNAGSEPVTITVTPPVNPPCPLVTGYRWTALTPNAPQLVTSATGAIFPTPPVVCQREGVSYVYRVEAIDTSGLASAPTDFTVQVLPWGNSLSPFKEEKQVDLLGGDAVRGSALLMRERTHACDTLSPDFPGVDTVWELVQGAASLQGIQLLAQDNTPFAGTSAVTPGLRVKTDACAKAQLVFSVQNYTRGGFRVESPPSTVRVNVEPQWAPVSDGLLSFTLDTSTPEFVSGTAIVDGLQCLEQRKGIKAHIRLEREDGSLVREGVFPVSGPWWFALGGVCEAQMYHLTGELLEGSGLRAQALSGGERGLLGEFSQPVVQIIDVPVPPAEVGLEPIEALSLKARCGQAASGTVEHSLPEGPCTALPLSWKQIGGPPLTQDSFTGQRIDVTTQETDFGALIGKSVVMKVTANTGKVTEIEQPILITADPFIELNRHVERAASANTEFMGVSVELRNTTECGVREVDLVERLEGVDYVPGSARFNDTPVEVELQGDSLQVRGLALEGNALGRLSYVVRPRLLEEMRFEGQSFLRDIPISQPLPEPPSAGCGCAGGGSGFAALGLAGLAAVLRRRRRP